MSTMTLRTAGRTALRALAVACASLALLGGAQAQVHGSRGGHGGGHFVHGGGPGFVHGGHYGPRFWGGVGLGLGLGWAGYYGSPWYVDPGYVVVGPPVVYSYPQPVPAMTPVPAPQSAPQPVIYPRNGQTAAKTDSDGNACSEWAGAQPNATTDASVFHRGFAACMDARGYTVR